MAEPLQKCFIHTIGLMILSVTLLISFTFNIIIFIKRRGFFCRDREECCRSCIYNEDRRLEDEGHYSPHLNHREQQENPENHGEQLENPIYGNINTERRDLTEVCYEMMTARTGNRMRSLEPDLNYASLDLKAASKHRKRHRRQQGHAQGRSKLQDQLPSRLTPPANSFLEVETDMDAQLPSRDTSTMVSHSSIYLNSQQIAQETEGMERDKDVPAEREAKCWETDTGSREWTGERKSEEENDRQERGNKSISPQSEAEVEQSGADHFTSSFSLDVAE